MSRFMFSAVRQGVRLALPALLAGHVVTAQTPGNLTLERWYNLSPEGFFVDTLQNEGIADRLPDSTILNNQIALGFYKGDHYGLRTRGTVTAPATGDYHFFSSGDDNVELWLSTDASRFNKRRIAWNTHFTDFQQWDKYATQRSEAIHLEAGQQYYIEVQMMEVGGNDHFAIGWARDWNAGGASSDFVSTPIEADVTHAWTENPDGSVSLSVDAGDITGSSDRFGFHHRQLTGDGEMIARISGLNAAGEWSKAGLMVRESLDADSVNAMMELIVGYGMSFQSRTTTGGISPASFHTFYRDHAYEWVRLVRKGDLLSGFTSSNGTDWEFVGSATLPGLPATVYVGFAAANDSVAGSPVTATIRDFTLLPVVADAQIPSAYLTSLVADPADLDDDNLPDAWELQNGLDPADGLGDQGEYGDPDGDLIANGRERREGTDPMVGNSVPGYLTEEVWAGIDGIFLEDLYQSPRFLLGADYRRLITQSEATRYTGSNGTGARVRGYLTAPETGDYRFWISGGKETRFWFSADEDKFHKEALISPHLYTGYRDYDLELSQQSRVIHLEAGQRCYLEMQFKEGAGAIGGSPVSLAWQPPGGNRKLIPAEHLSSYLRQADDLDDDDLPDAWELANGLDPADNGSGDPANGNTGDLDGDGLSNHAEYLAGTRADLADTDGDGISDYDELKALETDALVGDVDPFLNVQTISGASYIASDGGWATDGNLGHSTKVRGWVEYQINVPSDGVYLLDLAMGPRLGGATSAEYDLLLSIDGNFHERIGIEIADASIGNVRSLSPWLPAGPHTVRVFNDNALSFRRINIHSLEVLSAEGPDLDANGRPDWVDARLERLNGIDTRMTESAVSPICLEGRASYPELMMASGGIAVTPAAGDRWSAEVALDAQGPVDLHLTFENEALVKDHKFTWVPTNLLTESAITLRQGDSLRLTAFSGTSANGSDKVWLTIDGTTYNFKGKDPMEWQFDTAGTHNLDLVYRQGNGNSASEISRSITVTALAPIAIESPVCATGHVREWDLPALPDGTVLEIDGRIDVRDVIDLGNGATRYLIDSDTPETRYAHVRLGAEGPILQTIPMRGLTYRDAEQTSMAFVRDFGDGSYQVDMPVVLSNVHDDVRVHYDIYIAGTVFDTGGISKDYFPADFDDFGQAMVTFIKVGTDGSACHRVSIWQGDKRIVYSN